MFSGKKIKDVMNSKGLKVTYVAKQVGISVTYLSMIINDRRTPSLDILHAIASVLDVDVTEFFLDPEVSNSLNKTGGKPCSCS